LVVALEDRPEAAVHAWREIRPGLVLDQLEPGSFELLPLIYRQLAQCGHDEPELPRLKGIYRKTWVANTLLVERTKVSAEVLTTAGVPALFIEGVTLASRFYAEIALRPTAVVDIFVSERHESAALTRLAHAGWAATEDATSAVTGVRYLSDRNGHFCRLRSRLAIDCVVGSRDVLLADTDEWHSMGGANVRVPPPTETLFSVIVTNARRDVNATSGWVADAKMVLKAEIDWQRLAVLADQAGQISRLRDTLEYLTTLPGPKPPHAVITRLGDLKITRRERISYACTTSSIRGVGALPSLLAEHLAATADKSALSTIATFPSFLRRRWGLTHTWLVPIAAGRRALRLLDPRRQAT
jgi:hypothetical protein